MYIKLDIDFELTEELGKAIDDLLHHINHEDGRSEDRYRMEIDFWLRDALQRGKISREQYAAMARYYIHGDIYKDAGNPAYR